MSNSRPIGVFDSGIGGLTVVRQLKKYLPSEDIVYYGDTARVPYGTKSKETVLRFSIDNVRFLLKKKVKLILVACNTASSTALVDIRKRFKVPIIGVISSGARKAAALTKNNRIGIIGTRATVKSRSYERRIHKISKKIKVFSIACPLFVPLAEEGWLKRPVTKAIAREYLGFLVKKNIDTLILGCTHYPLLKPVIKNVLGKKVRLVDSACEVAVRVREILSATNAARLKKTKGRQQYYVSDEPENFKRVATMFLGYDFKKVKRV